MCTFLELQGKINENDVNAEAIKKSEIIFLEGYLWDEGEPKKAFEKQLKVQTKLRCHFQIIFCVDRHKLQFFELVKINWI